MNLGLTEKSALVVGGSRGLGRAIALGLAREGARVAIVARSASAIERTVEAMGGEANGHRGISMDLVPDGSPEALVARLEEMGINRIDILIHNLGGTLQVGDPLCGVSDWRKVWRLNLEIAIDINRRLIPKMKERGWGRIVHVSSVAAVLNHGSLPYGTVKAALNAYVKNLGAVLAPHGVVACGIMPGAILYEGSDWEKRSRDNPSQAAEFLNGKIAIGRFARPEEIASLAVFLSSEQASFFCGDVLPVDGGSR
ncbi:MAG: SDR family oxidoreductase [Deltaproteobacteria bacterium]|nr:SDR family oxidoreductase [Deltaproteobacteria bacterium]